MPDISVTEESSSLLQKKQVYFSIFSGQIYSIDADSEVDAFQIPLKSLPNSRKNCNKCFGRLHTGFSVTQKHYLICRKCMKTLLDVNKLAELNSKKIKTTEI